MIVNIIVYVAYISLLIELIFFHVPSIASTKSLFFKKANGSVKGSLLTKIPNYSFKFKLVVLIIPLLINICVFIFPLLITIINSVNLVDNPEGIVWFGLFFVILGRLLTFFSVLHIRKRNSQLMNEFYLHKKGLFSFSRNPGLIGMYFFILGLFLINPYVIHFVGVLFYMGYMHFKILLEEEFLETKFKNNYKKYIAKTPRYFLFIQIENNLK